MSPEYPSTPGTTWFVIGMLVLSVLVWLFGGSGKKK